MNFGSTSKPMILAASLSLILALFPATSPVHGTQKKQKMERSYREWLERDVTYIITKEERDEFQRLTTDEARDKFISDFWEVRNPDPGAPGNSYKDEIYRRIAFANARFGVGSGGEGWRSDRGRTYITLGEPQQKQVFRNTANLYPIEIWFYGNANPALPPGFYVMFYQREGSGDYRFYSPYVDGPDKLITGVEAINSRAAALRMIRDSAGPEVARIAVTLLPDEPVDGGQPSLESDILLGKIKSLANQPSNRDDILRRRSMRESVTTRLLLEGKNLDVVTFPARDSRGLTRLDYAIRLHNPSDLALTEENGRYSYSVEVRLMVYTADNKLIFTQQKSLRDSLDKKSLERIKDKVYGYEGTLPLPPGKYHLDIQFTDWTKKAAYRTARDVSIPDASKGGVLVPAVLPFSSAEDVDPALADLTPFTFASVRFIPTPNASPAMAPGTNLQVMYQIWAPPTDPKLYAAQKLQIEYAFGKPAARGNVTRVKDELSMEQFDSSGSIVTGKKLSLEQQTLGNYLLTVTVNPGSQPAFATTSFRILPDGDPESWDVLQPGISEDAEKGVLDQQRGLCYLALGEILPARTSFRRALQLNHSDEVARAHLVDLYYSKKDYRAVVSLFEDAGVSGSTDSETLLRIAASLREVGKTGVAISMLEKALDARPDDGRLYLALAGYYGQIGNARKAAELNEKGKAHIGPDRNRPQ